MTDEPGQKLDVDQRRMYQLRIGGRLSQKWMDWFEGMTITVEEDGNTLLAGRVIDQAALYGILKKVRDLGMPLLSINSSGPGSQKTVRFLNE